METRCWRQHQALGDVTRESDDPSLYHLSLTKRFNLDGPLLKNVSPSDPCLHSIVPRARIGVLPFVSDLPSGQCPSLPG